MENKISEIQVVYKDGAHRADAIAIKCSDHAAKVLHRHWDSDTIALQESFKVMLFNNANRLKGIYTASTGGITGTLVDLRIVFATILKSLSVGIILAHNHPSGQLKASQPDIQLTKKIQKAAALFDVKVLDHIIIVPNGDYFSFADNGLL